MKRHASHGADMLSVIKFPYPVVPIVRHHHEQWDGQGYPSGLKGPDIPMGARILSVVDCFDALTSDRPYRPRLSDAEALAILRERRGSFYDPAVVDMFLEIYPALAAGRTDISPAGPAAEAVCEALPARPHPPSRSDTWAGGAKVSAAEILRDLDRHHDLPGALDVVIEHLTRIVPASLTVFYLPEPSSDSLLAFHAAGPGAALIVGTRMRVGERISGWVAANRQTILNSDPVLDLGDIARTATPALHRCLSVPFGQGGTLVGVISFYAPRSVELTDHHRQLVEAVLATVAGAIQAHADRALAFESYEPCSVDRSTARVDNASRHAAPGVVGVH